MAPRCPSSFAALLPFVLCAMAAAGGAARRATTRAAAAAARSFSAPRSSSRRPTSSAALAFVGGGASSIPLRSTSSAVRSSRSAPSSFVASSFASFAILGRRSATRSPPLPPLGSTSAPSSSSSDAAVASSSSASPSAASSASSSSSASTSLFGIDDLRHLVASTLNDLYDFEEVARGAALAKLDGKKKKQKKKKKKKRSDEGANAAENAESEEPQMSEEERASLLANAVASARPFGPSDAMVTPATRTEFGDYQCNVALSLSKSLGLNPRAVASQIAERLEAKLEGVATMPLEIAGPGFINIKFDEGYLTRAMGAMAKDAAEGGRLAVPLASDKKKIVVDFSSPNIAKEMHVGHLRSTIIGDTLSNLLTFAGHDVVRLNHVGDWGTQFGMLVEHLRNEYPAALNKETSKDVDLGDLVALYKAAKKRFDVDDDFKARSREGVVQLQAGDPEALAAWESLCAASRKEYKKIYDALSIEGLDERGESFYNPYLLGVVEDLEKLGLAVESEGATAVFLDGYANRDGSPLPMLVRKSDGGFNYATTDLAAIRHRVQLGASEGGEEADRVLYVTDAGQSQHFEMVFAAARKAGFVPEGASLEHVPFGLVQGEDGKKFATRSGDTVKLRDLLDEAVRIAGEDVRARNDPNGMLGGDDAVEEEDDELREALDSVVRTVGIGAVKYADLSMNRASNYRFSYGRMLSLNGNTAPYMLYAYARICGIVRRATDQAEGNKIVWPDPADEVQVVHDSERQLARCLVKLPDVLREVEAELYPNRLCDYLFETSQKFNQFYENCSVNNAETPELKASRLSLCTVSAATIRLLMNLLGIPVVEKL